MELIGLDSALLPDDQVSERRWRSRYDRPGRSLSTCLALGIDPMAMAARLFKQACAVWLSSW